VLLSWRSKHLRIGLAPERIILTGARPIEIADGDGGWRAPLAALDPVLASRKGGEASVVLADAFTRYTLLAANETLQSAEQWLALARHRFSALHGARAAEWQVKVSETAPAGPRLACAVDRELLEALAAKFAASGTRLVSAQPFLVAAYNRIRASVGGGSCWVVVEERDRLTLVLIQRGTWLAIRSRRCDSRWRVTLPELLERESAFLGLSEPCTRVIVCAQSGFDTELHEHWRAHALSYRDLALSVE
jgi:hypothetical protein